MPRIDVGELSLNFEERGTGPAFLFIPGLVGLLNAWEFQMAEFSARYRCISFDHRGAGDSDKPSDAYATGIIARDGSRSSTRSASTRHILREPRPAAASCRTLRLIIPTGCAAASSPIPG
jgi:pimeloyl-ACP methyl ester carboxylesterase